MTAPDPDVDRPRHLVVRTTGPGAADVLLDGEEISNHVVAFQITGTADPRQVPTAVLEVRNYDGLFDGYARVQVDAGDSIDFESVARFCAEVDPEALEKAALARVEPGPHGTTKAILVQMAEWARGEG